MFCLSSWGILEAFKRFLWMPSRYVPFERSILRNHGNGSCNRWTVLKECKNVRNNCVSRQEFSKIGFAHQFFEILTELLLSIGNFREMCDYVPETGSTDSTGEDIFDTFCYQKHTYSAADGKHCICSMFYLMLLQYIIFCFCLMNIFLR